MRIDYYICEGCGTDIAVNQAEGLIREISEDEAVALPATSLQRMTARYNYMTGVTKHT